MLALLFTSSSPYIEDPSPMSYNLLFPTVQSLDRYWSRGNQGEEAICVSSTVKRAACCKKNKGTVLEVQ